MTRRIATRVMVGVVVGVILALLRPVIARAENRPSDWHMSKLYPAGTGYPTGGVQPLQEGLPRHIFGLSRFGADPTEVYAVVREEHMSFGSTGGGNLMGSTQVGYRLYDEDWRMPTLGVSAEQTAVAFYMASVLDYWVDPMDKDKHTGEYWAMAGPQNSFSYLKFNGVTPWVFGLSMTGHQLLPVGCQYYEFNENEEHEAIQGGTPIFEVGGGYIFAAHYNAASAETTYALWTASSGGGISAVVETGTVTGYLTMDDSVSNGRICYPTSLQRVTLPNAKDEVQFPKREQDEDQIVDIDVDGLWCSQYTTDTATVDNILEEMDWASASARVPDIRSDVLEGTIGGAPAGGGVGELPTESWEATGLDLPSEAPGWLVDLVDWLKEKFDPIINSMSAFFWPLTAIERMDPS